MADDTSSLSEREIEILRLVATGASNKEIASSLVISPNTVKVHLRNIFGKIGVVSRTEATLYALKHGIIQHPGGDSGPGSSSPGVRPNGDGSEEIFLASPIAMAESQEALAPRTAPPRRFPLLLAILLTAAIVAAGLLGTALLTNRRPDPAVSASTLRAATAVPLSRWKTLDPLPEAMSGMGVALYDGRTYLLGGSNGKTALQSVYRSTADGKWEALPAKPTAASDIQAALVGELIYVPGGRTGDGKISSALEVFDPRQNRWSQKASLPKALSGYGLVAFEGKLYCFGGWDGSRYSKDVYIYDPGTDRWSAGTPLPGPRAFMAADGIEGKIVVAGGFDGTSALKDVFIYIPSRENGPDSPWSKGPDLPQPAYNQASASLANMVYLLGGQSDLAGKSTPRPLVLDPEQSAWVKIDNSPQPVGSQAAAVSSGNFIHLYGGTIGQAASALHAQYQAIYTISIPLTTN